MVNESGPSPKVVGTREWYDFIGQMADLLPGVHLGGQEATETLLELCRLEENSQVLDVGCGSGLTACLIAQRYGAQVRGIDLSPVMVSKARERAARRGLHGKVEFRVADAFDLPFERDLFDVVLMESVLTPLAGDKARALAEMIKVSKPGARIAANESTVDPAAPQELLDLFREHPATHGYFTQHTLRSLFEQAGLEVTHLEDVRSADIPSARREMKIGGLLSFMFRVYPRILWKLLRDERFRRAGKIDDQITKGGAEYMGYTLIVGEVLPVAGASGGMVQQGS